MRKWSLGCRLYPRLPKGGDGYHSSTDLFFLPPKNAKETNPAHLFHLLPMFAVTLMKNFRGPLKDGSRVSRQIFVYGVVATPENFKSPF